MGLEERRKREKEGRKNAILKAARKLSFEKGFKSITVASIAKKAELSKGAVYLYFNSKEEIYVEILLKDNRQVPLHPDGYLRAGRHRRGHAQAFLGHLR